MTQLSLHEALLARMLEHARTVEAPASPAHKPGLLAAVRAAGWRPQAGLRHASPPSSRSDHELAHAFRAGDADAFDELFSCYHGKLIAYARRSGCSADAEDLAQLAFVALTRAPAFGDDPAFNVRGYLFTVVRNQAIKLGVRRAREESAADSSGPEPVDPEPSALEQLLARHERERVVALIESHCNPAQQTVLAMTHAGASTEAIAAELETTVGNVRVIRHRALTKLRAAIDENPP